MEKEALSPKRLFALSPFVSFVHILRRRVIWEMKISYAFVSGYTAKGYRTFLPNWLRKQRRIIILTGMPGSGKSTFIRKMGLNLASRGYEVQFWPSPLDPGYLQGLFFPQLSTAVVDGDWPDLCGNWHPGQAITTVNLGDYYVTGEDIRGRQEVKRLWERMEQLWLAAAVGIINGVRGEKESEPKEKKTANFGLERDLGEHLEEEILGWHPGEAHYFAGVITAEGKVDLHEEILKACLRRYILKGSGISIKSRIMLKVGKEALNRGHAVSFYHSGFDPEYLEIAVVETLKVALVDGDAVEVAGKAEDREIDLAVYAEAGRVAADVEATPGRPDWLEVYQAVEKLQRVREVEEKLARLVTGSMAFEKIDDKREKLIKDLLSIV